MNERRANRRVRKPGDPAVGRLSEGQAAGSDELKLHQERGEKLIKKGEPFLAFQEIDAGLKAFPGDVTLRRLKGLALARAGATRQAHEILDGLYREELGRRPGRGPEAKKRLEETWSGLARVYKDFGLDASSSDPAAAAGHWRMSLDLYTKAYGLRKNYFPGINVAAVQTYLGETEHARRMARRVRRSCKAKLSETQAGDRYWLYATLGEACLIAGDMAAARDWYGRAAKLGQLKRDYGSMGSTRLQLENLARKLGLNEGTVGSLFPMPRVAVFAGHMVDRPDRPRPRFPAADVPAVKAQIREWLRLHNIRIGYASAANGSDLIFLRALLNRGGEAHIVLPCAQAAFVKTSVGDEWKAEFEAVLRHRKSTVVTLPGRPIETGTVTIDYANQVLDGLAMLHARQLGSELRHLVVWNGEPGDGPGGTADVAGRWLTRGDEVDVIRIPGAGPATPFSRLDWPRPVPRPIESVSSDFGTQIKALLFADVVKFSELSEEQIECFVKKCLRSVADLLASGKFGAEHRNTWGDGIYIVFDDLGNAGRFALALAETFRSVVSTLKELPETLNIRTALHAGPVFLCTDPVTERPNCIGTHVSHAARIEPITPPGEVYASQAFAALAEAMNIEDFTCRFVGNQNLAKNYGNYPTFHVTPKAR